MPVLLFVLMGLVVGLLAAKIVDGSSCHADGSVPWITNALGGALLFGLVGSLLDVRAPDPVSGQVLSSFIGTLIGVRLHYVRTHRLSRKE